MFDAENRDVPQSKILVRIDLNSIEKPSRANRSKVDSPIEIVERITLDERNEKAIHELKIVSPKTSAYYKSKNLKISR